VSPAADRAIGFQTQRKVAVLSPAARQSYRLLDRFITDAFEGLL